MKILILLMTMTASLSSQAQVCSGASKEMTRYMEQKDYKSWSLPGTQELATVSGYLDGQNRFRFDDLSRSGNFKATLILDPANQGNKQFFENCAKVSEYGSLLRLMRRQEHNKYTVTLRFLPELKDIPNPAFSDQHFKWLYKKLKIDYDPQSLIVTQYFDPLSLEQDIYANLSKQIARETAPDVVVLDLSGYDDFVCDLIQGKASLSLKQQATSEAPLVKMDKVVEPTEVQSAYDNLRAEIPDSFSKEEALFMAGRVTSKLQQQGALPGLSDEKAFGLVKQFMSTDLSHVETLDPSAVACAAASMQKYTVPDNRQIFDLGFTFDSLDQIKNQSGVK